MLDRLDNRVQWQVELFGKLGEVVASNFSEMLINDLSFKSVAQAEEVELKKEAFSQVGGTNSRRVEILNGGQGILEAIERNLKSGGKVSKRRVEVTVIREISDNDHGIGLSVSIKTAFANLFGEVLLQGEGSDNRVVEMFPRLDGILAHPLIAAFHDGEFTEVVIVGFLPIIEVFRIFLLGVGDLVERLILCDVLKDGIDFHRLIEELAKLKSVGLQNLQALAHLRRERLLLRERLME